MATPDDTIVAAAAEQVDTRNQWRRREDIRRNAIIVGLAALLVTGGIAWGTALTTVEGKLAQKVDRTEYVAHVASEDKRTMADSIARAQLAASLARIESKQDSTNARLSRFICNKQPAYCQ